MINPFFHSRLILIILLACISCQESKSLLTQETDTLENNQIHEKYDSTGLLIEKYGYDNSFDNEGYFKILYFYNEHRQLVREKYYFFFDKNPECDITKYPLSYVETHYEYQDTVMVWEKRYNPEYNRKTKTIDLHLFYMENHKTGEKTAISDE